jgi:GINS complex subunit 2
MTQITSAETIFCAENELVSIVPLFEHPRLELLSGFYGPFKRNEEIKVPIWLACHLKKRQRCNLIWPEYLQVGELLSIYEITKTHKDFYDFGFYYGEIAKILLDCFEDENPNSHRMRALIEDIQSIRVDRLKLGLGMLSNQVSTSDGSLEGLIKIPGVGSIDLLSTKQYITASIDMFFKMETTKDDDDEMGDTGDDVTDTARPVRKSLRRRDLKRRPINAEDDA